MRLIQAGGLLLLPTLLAQPPLFDKARLSSQALSFAEQLPNLIGTEKLQQKSISYSTRMRILVGEAALRPIEPKIWRREITSEIGYALRGKDSPVWYELRKVIDVDGKTVTAPKKARERLAFGLRNDDERHRFKMLEEFMSYGLDGLATDYGLSLLLFRSGEITKFNFQLASSEFIGADRISVYAFERTDGEAAVTIFDGKQASRQPLTGLIWLRDADLKPLRIKLVSLLRQNGADILDEGTVEYGPSKFGCVLPERIEYTRKINGNLTIETLYTYSGFQKFGADAELKFNE